MRLYRPKYIKELASQIIDWREQRLQDLVDIRQSLLIISITKTVAIR